MSEIAERLRLKGTWAKTRTEKEKQQASDFAAAEKHREEELKREEERQAQARVRYDTVVALTDVTLLVYGSAAYENAQLVFRHQQTKEVIDFLSSVPVFNAWSFSKLRHIRSLIHVKQYKKGEVVGCCVCMCVF